MGEPTDLDLVQRARSGDRNAFARLIAPRVQPSWRLVRAIGGQDVDPDDVVQEALIMAWRDLPSLRNAGSFDGWLRRIVLNATRHALRDRKVRRIRVVAGADERSGGEPSMPGPGSAVAEREAIERAFGRLSVDHRSILVLRLLEDHSMEAVAETLGIPVGTAKSRLHHARTALRAALAAESR
ncbi:MAG TPA: RNA polymerase sigma factor [Candidatus Limnocylindrales bacterium]|nr:RNA polymerase sigma factor [Candidatus Limnocylindrales bacterium]